MGGNTRRQLEKTLWTMWFFFHFFEKHNWSFITEVIWEETRNASPSLECRRRGLWCFCLFFFFHVRLCNDRWRLIIKKIKQRSKYCSCVLTFAFAFFTRMTQMRVLTLVGGAYDRDKTCWKKAVFSWGVFGFPGFCSFNAYNTETLVNNPICLLVLYTLP